MAVGTRLYVGVSSPPIDDEGNMSAQGVKECVHAAEVRRLRAENAELKRRLGETVSSVGPRIPGENKTDFEMLKDRFLKQKEKLAAKDAQIEAMGNILKECEWNQVVFEDCCARCSDDMEEQCQICMAHHHDGHKPDCRMVAALKSKGAGERG